MKKLSHKLFLQKEVFLGNLYEMGCLTPLFSFALQGQCNSFPDVPS